MFTGTWSEDSNLSFGWGTTQPITGGSGGCLFLTSGAVAPPSKAPGLHVLTQVWLPTPRKEELTASGQISSFLSFPSFPPIGLSSDQWWVLPPEMQYRVWVMTPRQHCVPAHQKEDTEGAHHYLKKWKTLSKLLHFFWDSVSSSMKWR